MKNLHSFFTILFLLLFVSGCSQQHRSNSLYANSGSKQYTQFPYYGYSTQPRASQQISQRAQSSVVNNYHPVRNLMVQIATSTIGVPYKWGGNNPQRGFDCSGLMTYVHKNALGMKIPRTAAQQRNASRTINYAQLQPGDMLFFKTGRNSNHVGVYIGDRKFVHAATGSKHVKVASMDNSYWHSRFVKFGTFL